jgi:hypothetical protein
VAAKIHFAALYGTGYDMDIFPWWAEHYLSAGFDSYMVFLHDQNVTQTDPSIVMQFKNAGFKTSELHSPHGDGRVRGYALSTYARSLPPDDILVTADADEFQPPLLYRGLERNYDVATGFLVDHYSDSLDPCSISPFVQYPYKEQNATQIVKNFSPPQYRSSIWPLTRRTKVLFARAGYDVMYVGSHFMRDCPVTARVLSGISIPHFCWRESARRKLAVKSYFSSENISELYDNDVPVNTQSLYDSTVSITTGALL